MGVELIIRAVLEHRPNIARDVLLAGINNLDVLGVNEWVIGHGGWVSDELLI